MILLILADDPWLRSIISGADIRLADKKPSRPIAYMRWDLTSCTQPLKERTLQMTTKTRTDTESAQREHGESTVGLFRH